MSEKVKIQKDNFLVERIKRTQNIQTQNTHVPFPKNALIELNTSCNHSCVFCTNPRMKRKSSNLSIELFEDFVKEAVSLGLLEIGFYTTGEPLMNKNILHYIEIAAKHHVPYIYITTNGALASLQKLIPLLDAGLNSIKFSINAGTRETYQLIHGQDDFEKVYQNVQDLRNYVDANNLSVKILSSFIATKFSEQEVDLYIHQIGPLVDDYAVMGTYLQGGQSIDEYWALKSKYSPTIPKRNEAQPCGMLWSRIHLTQEGYLSLCCVDYENNLIYSKYEPGKLSESWNSEVIKEMRKRHLNQQLEGTLCDNCLYGEKKPYQPLMKVDFFEKNNTASITNVWNRIDKLSKEV